MNTEELVAITKDLISINSISGTKNKSGEYNENVIAKKIVQYFKMLKYPVSIFKTQDGRNCVFVRKQGTSKKTIVLIAHHDTVGIEDYGDLNPFDSDILTKVFKDKQFLYGRGSGDMKSGIAAAISLFSLLKPYDLKTNVIFISAPDEENGSAGIIAAVKYLSELKRKESLEYIGLVNLDSALQNPTTNTKTIIAGGTVGKLLPCFYVLGRAAHVSDPFEGISSNSIGCEILNEFDQNARYSNKNAFTKEITPPPTCLKFEDLKNEYNVQLPLKSFLYFNYLTYNETPEQVMTMMKHVAQVSLQKALTKNQKLYRNFCKKQKIKPHNRNWDQVTNIYTYSELETIAKSKNPKMETKLKEILQSNASEDPRTRNLKVVEYVVQTAQISTPSIVCFFSPPFYPSSYTKNSSFIKTIKSVVKNYGESENIEFDIKDFSEGISDMNYMQIEKTSLSASKEYLKNNPLSDRENEVNLDDIAYISMPISSIGPYAFYPHQMEDRVEIDFTLNKLPHLLEKIILAFN